LCFNVINGARSIDIVNDASTNCSNCLENLVQIWGLSHLLRIYTFTHHWILFKDRRAQKRAEENWSCGLHHYIITTLQNNSMNVFQVTHSTNNSLCKFSKLLKNFIRIFVCQVNGFFAAVSKPNDNKKKINLILF